MSDITHWQEQVHQWRYRAEGAEAEVERLRAALEHCESEAGSDSCAGILRENDRLRTLIRDLVHVGTGATPHLYDGLCPDEVEGYDTRNPNCRACAVLCRDRSEGARLICGGEGK